MEQIKILSKVEMLQTNVKRIPGSAFESFTLERSCRPGCKIQICNKKTMRRLSTQNIIFRENMAIPTPCLNKTKIGQGLASASTLPAQVQELLGSLLSRFGRGVQQPRKLRIFKFKEVERATNFFSEKNMLGKGSHTSVYKGVLSNADVVSVKRPTLGRRTMQDAISFNNELEILSKLRHRHLVNLIGFCTEANEKLLVVEFMENGNLFELLHSSGQPLSWSARMYMALQAAKAVLALRSASPQIIHRNVKSSNIVIDSNWNAKLADLGLALRGRPDDVARKETPPAGTTRYIDPEYQTPAHLSSKSDVFSFGILLLEIISGRKAIDVRYDPSSLLDWAVPLIKQGDALAVCDKALKPPQTSFSKRAQ